MHVQQADTFAWNVISVHQLDATIAVALRSGICSTIEAQHLQVVGELDACEQRAAAGICHPEDRLLCACLPWRRAG